MKKALPVSPSIIGIVFIMYFVLGISSFNYFASLGAYPTFYEVVVSQTNDINIFAYGIFFTFAIILASYNKKQLNVEKTEFKKLNQSFFLAFITLLVFFIANALAYSLLTLSLNLFESQANMLSTYYDNTTGVFWGSLLLILVRIFFLTYLFFSMSDFFGGSLAFIVLILINYFDRYLIIVKSTVSPPLLCMGTYSLYDYTFTSYIEFKPNYLKHLVFWIIAFGIVLLLNYLIRKIKSCKKKYT